MIIKNLFLFKYLLGYFPVIFIFIISQLLSLILVTKSITSTEYKSYWKGRKEVIQ